MSMKKWFIALCAVVLTLTVVFTTGIKQNSEQNDQISGNQTVTDTLIQTGTKEDELVPTPEPVTTVSLSTPKKENDDIIIDLIEIKQEEIKQENVVKQPDPVINETGGLDVPFDVAYPEIFEQDLLTYSKETLMIKFDQDFVKKAGEELVNTGIDHLQEMFKMNDSVWFTAYVKEGKDIKEVMASVRALDYVQVAEYNFQYETAEVINWDEAFSENTEYVNQWYTNQYGIEEGWQTVYDEIGTAGGRNSVVVAVIDSGVDYTHKDLAANMWKNTAETPDNGIDDDGNGFIDDYYGANMYVDLNGYSDNSNGMDDNGHGTHVAGIIAAVNNKEGVVGLAHNVQIMNIKAADASGYLLQSNIAKAILYAYDKGAEVINMSFGGTASSIAVQDALATAYTRSVLVASAGNSGAHNEFYLNPIPNYPAAHPYVLGVMSVGQTNVESRFTNYDVLLYSNVEYEVYAPGEQIISTLPGDRYGKLSGTSMAAPVVAAQAALLRSMYADHNTYPTKFIYGQIVGTADAKVICLNPKIHGLHNIPGVVNFHRSLTEMPKPDVGVSDYTLFDTAGFEHDVNNMNNGDGIVDAGETIALGFTLKNRWGMSENTVVTLDARSVLGYDDEGNKIYGPDNPYVTFLNNDINYGSVGTYSESDSGKIKENDQWIGWENPFYVQISKDCPNNYSITINVTVRYENGLDEQDQMTYVNDTYQVTLVVRRGVVLPNLIEEDMTLTKDNYYIIPNATTVRTGATLTIEAGTKIQFWCSDPSDAYADTGIAYLRVENGAALIVSGTEEEPVEMFPSDWMGRYRVEIQKAGQATIELNYAKITNPYVDATKINNCEFTYTYNDYLYYRYLSGGQVSTNMWGSGLVQASEKMFGSSFYKVGGSSRVDVVAKTIDTCIFVDSKVNLSGEMLNNVFYGNNVSLEDGNKNVTSIIPEDTNSVLNVRDFFEHDDYIYFTVESKEKNETIMERFFDLMDVDWFSINSLHEYVAVTLNMELLGNSSYFYNLNLQRNEEGEFINHDSTEIKGVSIDAKMKKPVLTPSYDYSSDKTSWGIVDFFGEGLGYYELAEKKIPYVKTLKLDEYLFTMEAGKSKGIEAIITPSYLDYSDLIFESENPDVVTVDEEGIVTAVANGSANVYVYSSDRALWTYVTVNVVDPLPIESLETEEYVLMFENTYHKLDVDITPLASTETITYTSGDATIASVDKRGKLYGINPGETTVTVAGEHGLSKEVKVIVVPEDFTLAYPNEGIIMAEVDGLTSITPVMNYQGFESLYSFMKFSSSNPEFGEVTEEQNLLGVKEGRTVVRVEIPELELSADANVFVMKTLYDQKVKQIVSSNAYGFIAVTESGDVWYWGEDYHYAVHTGITDAETIAEWKGNSTLTLKVLCKDATLKEYDVELNGTNQVDIIATDVELISKTNFSSIGRILYTKKDGTLWQIGGLSTSLPVCIDWENTIPIKKMLCTNASFYVLDNEGNLYFKGGENLSFKDFMLIDIDVESLVNIGNGNVQINKLDSYYVMSDIRSDSLERLVEFTRTSSYEVITNAQEHQENCSRFKIVAGKVFAYGADVQGETGTNKAPHYGDFNEVYNVQNVKEIINGDEYNGYRTYFITKEGKLYGTGDGTNYAFANGFNSDQYVPVPIYFGLADLMGDKKLSETSTNTEEVLFENQLNAEEFELTYNDKLIEYLAFENIKLETTHKFDGFTAITTKEQLSEIRDNLYGKYYLASDIVFEESDFEEGGAFYNDGYGWLPIGDDVTPFSGILDGNGYMISGLTIKGSGTYAGLFGEVSGVVRNVVLEIGSIESTGAYYAGGIAGVSRGTIENCYVKDGGIYIKASNSHVGGIAGSGSGVIKNCQVEIAGGIYGQIAGGIAGNYSGAIENCTAEMIELEGVDYAGGIAGVSNNLIENCASTISYKITGTTAGGIAGASAGKIVNSTAEHSFEIESNGSELDNIYGGIVGELTGSVENSTYYVERSSIVSGMDIFGGIAGVVPVRAFNGFEPSSVEIKNCSVLFKEALTTTQTEIQIAGGLIGRADIPVSVSTSYIGDNDVALANEKPEWLNNNNSGWLIGEVKANSAFTNCVTSFSGMNAAGNDVSESTYTNCVELLETLNESNYSGFDFENTWTIKNHVPALTTSYTDIGYSGIEPTDYMEEYVAISTKEQLNAIRDNLYGNYYLTNDIVFSSSDFAEGGAFYNDGYGWLPIGNDEAPFAGVLDGNGYTISGLTIKKADHLCGLFGEVSGAVRNLKLSIAGMTCSDATYAGVVAGVVDSTGVVENCHISGDGYVNSYASNSNSGGVAGHNSGSIKNCTSWIQAIYGDITGGIAGTSTGTIENCDVSFVELNGNQYVGGIAGVLSGTIENCGVSINMGLYGNVAGGIAGASVGEISKCIASHGMAADSQLYGGIVGQLSGSVESSTADFWYTNYSQYNVETMGGIAGVVPSTAYNGYEPSVASIIKDCAVSFTENQTALNNKLATVGGLVGYTEKPVDISSSYLGANKSTYYGVKPGWLYGESEGLLIGNGNSSVQSTVKDCYTSVTDVQISGNNNQISVYKDANCYELLNTVNPSNFTGFDFEKVWEYVESKYHNVRGVVQLRASEETCGFVEVESFIPNPEDYGPIDAEVELTINSIVVKPVDGFEKDAYYRVTVPMGAVQNPNGVHNSLFKFVFKAMKGTESNRPGEEKNPVIHETFVDEEKMNEREEFTEGKIVTTWADFVESGLNTRFYSNVILNRLDSESVESWLRIMAPNASSYQEISLGGNYWGTDNEFLINKQILDYDDYQHLADINVGDYLTEAPDYTYPFVVDAYLEVTGEQVDTVGNELVTFVVNFNRDMDTSIDLDVRFGSAYPYADYQVEGAYVEDNPRQWRGTMQLTTIIENGYQYWSVSEGKAAGTSYKLYKDWGRFPFMIDTSQAQALVMNAVVEPTGIQLTWVQDDFETLAGYNVYRSTAKDGLYVKLNKTVIPADTKEWFDDEVVPGQLYYYNFTVVQSDMSESEPSGKVSVTAMDTMPPDIYHSPVYHGFTGQNLIINAIVTDNVGINAATVYYRVKGTEEYQSVPMTNNNDKYSAIIPADAIQLEGLEYYIEATDGIGLTYIASAEEPYEVLIQQAVSANQMGDVNGDGQITLQDAMKVLYAKYGRYNMPVEEFMRADLDGSGELDTFEALIIIQYVNGTITSIPTYQ